MPYIKDEDKAGAITTPSTAGELNFAITNLIQTYLSHSTLNYQAINDIVGALEGAKAEFQRRVVAPYEDIKIRENGDCYLPEFLSIPKESDVSKSNMKYLGLSEDDLEFKMLLEENIVIPHTYPENIENIELPKDDLDANCG